MEELFKQVYFDFKNIYDLSNKEKQNEIIKYWIANCNQLNDKYIPILFDTGNIINPDIIMNLVKNPESLVKIINKKGDTAVQIFFLENHFYENTEFKHLLFTDNRITNALNYGAFSLLNDVFILKFLNKHTDKEQIKQNYLDFLNSTKKYMDNDFSKNLHYFNKCFKRLFSSQLHHDDLNCILFTLIDFYPEVLKYKEVDNEYLTIYNNKEIDNVLSILKGKSLIPFIERYKKQLNLTSEDLKVLCSTVFIFSENAEDLDKNISFLSNNSNLSKYDIIKNIFKKPDNDDKFYPTLLKSHMTRMNEAKINKNRENMKKLYIKLSYDNSVDKFKYIINNGATDFNTKIKMVSSFSLLNFNISAHSYRNEVQETILSLNSFVLNYLKELSIENNKPISFNIFLNELKRNSHYSFSINNQVESSILDLYPYIEEDYEALRPVFEQLKVSEDFHNQYLILESNKEIKHIFDNSNITKKPVKRI